MECRVAILRLMTRNATFQNAPGICHAPHKIDECDTKPKHARHSQKSLWPRRHFPKKRRFRRQAINLAPPERVRAWGMPQPPEDRGAPVLAGVIWMPASWNLSDSLDQLLPEPRHPTWSVYLWTRAVDVCPSPAAWKYYISQCYTSVFCLTDLYIYYF